MDKVEVAFGTTEQTVDNMRLGIFDGPLLSALASWLSRQQQKLTAFNIATIELTNKKAAEDFKILMQASSAMTIQLIRLDGANLGTEGFGWVAEGPQSQPGLLLESVYISKSTLERGKPEDLRVLWDALIRPDGFLVVEVGRLEERLETGGGETAWTRLCQIRDEPAAYWIKERMRFEVMLMIEAEGWDVQEEEDEDEEVEEEEEEEEGELGG